MSRRPSPGSVEGCGEGKARGRPTGAQVIWAGVCRSSVALLLHQGAVFALTAFLPLNEAGTRQPLLCQLALSLSLYFPVIALQALITLHSPPFLEPLSPPSP